ncbi:hypothetical protein FA13DRAFT_1832626 [Coprinellus micaceus]|uniref:Uncharacterized protein n=1 Tax=Coprinellus micaceus TaxID=71717 RepID=A0A4Y7SHH6_COPMI|nr:hypothetical protein FA13DRAFT_1832626 [Coprinellus micaceus]
MRVQSSWGGLLRNSSTSSLGLGFRASAQRGDRPRAAGVEAVSQPVLGVNDALGSELRRAGSLEVSSFSLLEVDDVPDRDEVLCEYERGEAVGQEGWSTHVGLNVELLEVEHVLTDINADGGDEAEGRVPVIERPKRGIDSLLEGAVLVGDTAGTLFGWGGGCEVPPEGGGLSTGLGGNSRGEGKGGTTAYTPLLNSSATWSTTLSCRCRVDMGLVKSHDLFA